MKKLSFIKNLLLVLTAIPFASFAEVPKIIFEENKNQWPDQVLYQATIRGGSIFLEKNTFTYVYMQDGIFDNHGDNLSDTSIIKFHAFKVDFLNSNSNVEVSGNNLMEGCRNYYRGNDQKRWASGVRLYSQVNYKNLYPAIDMNVYNVEENLKYDLVVHPEGNIKNIKLNYTGPDEMHLEYGHLYIQTSVGLIIEQKPYAYQEINGLKSEVTCSYILKNNTLSFEVGSYDHSLPLVIDPTIIGATYTGSTTDNRGYTATYDAASNMYTGGKAFFTGYPVTPGAFQQSYNGPQPGNNSPPAWDIVLSKFNPTATTLLFSTYYGGTGDEQPHSIIVNSNNELYVSGRTNSSDFPTTNGSVVGNITTSNAYDKTYNGGYDIIVGKFNSTGKIMSSTYIGGISDDGVNIAINTLSWTPVTLKYTWGDCGRSEIILDANSNVYVAACTQSINFPTSAGAYQTLLKGTQDGVVFKMNSTLTTLNFSTYLGGNGYDAAYGLKLDNSGKIYVTGGTTSNDFPMVAGVNPPVLHNTFQGGTTDGFIAVLDPSSSNAAQLLRATYLGTNAYDQAYLIEIDASGDLYVYGQTAGTYPVAPAGTYCFPAVNPTSGMFIHKLKGNLSTTVFSTVIGTATGKVNLSPTAFLIDSCQTIYISGWGRCDANPKPPFGPWGFPNASATSTTGLPTTANAFQKTTDGCDFYFAVLAPDAKSLEYATFFGENEPNMPDHVDGGTSRFDKRGVIYESICASCFGTSGIPTTQGAWSSTNNAANNCNNFLLKMDIAPRPHAAASVTGAANGCAPFVVKFSNINGTDTSKASAWIWDFGDGGVSYASAPTYTYNFPGTYTVTIYALDTIGICGYQDRAYVAIKVGASPSIAAYATNVSCNPGLGTATVTVTPNGATNPLTYSWLPSGGSTQIASGLTPGTTYSVTVSDALGCSNTKTVSVTQPAILTLTASATTALCGSSNGSASAIAGGGTLPYTYAWNPGGNTTSTVTGIAQGDYSVTLTDANGCTQTQTVTVPVANGPTVTVTSTNPVLCYNGTSGSATAVASGGTLPYTYAWLPSAGTTATATGLVAGTIYHVTITDANGCYGTASVKLSEPAKLVGSLTQTDVKCFGDHTGSATVSMSGGTTAYTYLWNTTPLQTTQTALGLAAGTYSALITDANGCTNIQYATIHQPVAPLSSTTYASGSVCGAFYNGVAQVIVTGGSGTYPYTYKWMPGGQTSSIITKLMDGTYSVIITDANACTSINTVVVPKNTLPVADFTAIPHAACEGVIEEFISSTGSNALTWYWNFAGLGTSTSANPSFMFPYTGNYNVTLVVTNPPCADTITKTVAVPDFGAATSFDAANIFSPNGDGRNDCFHPSFMENGSPTDSLLFCYGLEVFDRWGVKMYSCQAYGSGDHCWNGKNMNDNKPAVDGTYYYIATLGSIKIKGYVTLVSHK